MPLAIALTWLYSDSFWTRLLRACVAASFNWLSRESTMFCLSSSDSAFSFSRYSASARSLSSTLLLLAGQLVLEPVEHALRRPQLDLEVLADVLVDQRVHRIGGELRILEYERDVDQVAAAHRRDVDAADERADQRRFVRRLVGLRRLRRRGRRGLRDEADEASS